MLARKGVPPMAVVTRIKFVSDVAYPQLDFKPIGLLPPEKVKEVQVARQLEVVDYIVGRVSAPVVAAAAAVTEVEEEVAPEPKPTPKPTPKPSVDEDDEVEEAPKPKAAKKPKVVEEDPEVDELLEGLDEL
jgi:outer membrane biosynthesis protein TonB